MYRSLYNIVTHRVEQKSTGVLKLLHAGGQSGEIQFSDGAVCWIAQEELSGAEAANIIFRWINIAVIFLEGASINNPSRKRLNTDFILEQLKKVDTRVRMFKELIGGCDAVFRFTGQDIDGQHQFSPKDLSVSFLLDGKTSIKEAQKKSDLNELDMLVTICRLIKTGLVKKIHSHKPMAGEKRSVFLDELNDILSDITGPVASVIINDAFEAIGAPPEELAECDLPHLYSVVRHHLEEDERAEFTKWLETFKK